MCIFKQTITNSILKLKKFKKETIVLLPFVNCSSFKHLAWEWIELFSNITFGVKLLDE
jgi:hypothetical protein